MSSTITTTILPREAVALAQSPLAYVYLIPGETGVSAPVNNLLRIASEAVAAAQLGDTSKYGRRWYEYLESLSQVDMSVLPFTPGGDLATIKTNAIAALDVMTDSEQLANIGNNVDVLVIPDYASRETGLSSILTKAELVSEHVNVDCLVITDSYFASSSTLANQSTWATANLHPNILGITNKATVNGAAEWGSAVTAAHLAKFAALEGIGSHPFSLSHPLTGVGATDPKRIYNLADGTAAADVLKDENLTSIIQHDGFDYMWGGKLKTVKAGDNRHLRAH